MGGRDNSFSVPPQSPLQILKKRFGQYFIFENYFYYQNVRNVFEAVQKRTGGVCSV
ncbi:hypothetical protein NMA510612_1748 [Neisseria meningitidis]|uniref:Uncharacterized protein n=1 Tax=Neisseria meningitidis TaxID=487 RepID=X5ESL1_NEIME|nr:hypothetical protein NMA510612_1748 [Neisseria meningitidis]